MTEVNAIPFKLALKQPLAFAKYMLPGKNFYLCLQVTGSYLGHIQQPLAGVYRSTVVSTLKISITEKHRLFPHVPVFEYTDSYGNLCQRLIAPPGDFAIYTTADVKAADQVDQAPGAPFVDVEYLPDSVLSFLLPSRYRFPPWK